MNERIELPAGHVVECPKTGCLERLEVCAACEHHKGVTPARFPGNAGLAFRQQHAVACAFPIARRVLKIGE